MRSPIAVEPQKEHAPIQKEGGVGKPESPKEPVLTDEDAVQSPNEAVLAPLRLPRDLSLMESDESSTQESQHKEEKEEEEEGK